MSLVDELSLRVSGCDCEACGDSGLGSECPCLGLDGLGGDVGSECGPGCRCGPECGNRLTQNGVAVRVKIVRDRRKGWCLYADQFIRKGQFLFEYAGNANHCHLLLLFFFFSLVIKFFAANLSLIIKNNAYIVPKKKERIMDIMEWSVFYWYCYWIR